MRLDGGTPRRLKPAAQVGFPAVRRHRRTAVRAGFSLLELMIGIVILGLGMVMVATIFPVAWSRARTLSEFTVQRTITASAQVTVQSLLRASGPTRNATSFQGDVLCNEFTAAAISACALGASDPTDTWVHALNLENVRVTDRRFVDENVWRIEGGLLDLAELSNSGHDFIERSFFRKTISFHERMYPPIGRRENVDFLGEFTGPDDRWDNALASRRFCWSVLYRLRDPLEVDRLACTPPGSTRSFDIYYVTLRRGQSALRYARQDPTLASMPDPCLLNGVPVTPAADDPDEDVMFPVPWRVQVQFPDTLERRFDVLGHRRETSGIPTEIEVPPSGITSATARVSLVQMFSRGTQFIDEITGEVYRVIRRRITGIGDTAKLTLNREVLFEDIDLPKDPALPSAPLSLLCPACGAAGAALDGPELLRTVWVFPPPVEPRASASDPLVFSGSQPVVAIDIRTLNMAPSS